MMVSGLIRALCAIAVVLCAAPACGQDRTKEPDRTGGPYVPTPQIVVDEMLRMAKVGAGDFVMDLGSGDGVIVLTAAKQFKAHGMGIEIDPELVKLSNESAQRLGIADRVSFQVQDIFKADLRRASVLTLYLLPSMMNELQSKVFGELKPGARVVSHDYHFGDDWRPDDYISFDVPEKEKVNGVPRATIYLWVVPSKIAGKWRLRIDSSPAAEYDLDLKQRYQSFDGSALAAGKAMQLEVPHLRGDEIRFAIGAGAGRRVFQGRVNGDAMDGKVQLGTGRGAARWTATRVGVN
ncbi:MAG TPA: methyltransferase domain-containing protein [Burkholderiales bacterium]|nr:methyltransferase domain-containing protein [Burkholderiales bacterium]